MGKRMLKLLCVLFCALLLAGLVGALGEGQTGRLTVKLTPQQNLPDVSGVTFAMYKVGHVDRSTTKGNVWATEGAYASVDFVNAETAREVEEARDAIGAIVNSTGATPTYTATTASNGEAVFKKVEIGLYYVQMTSGPQYLVVTPALVTMPMVTEEDGVTYTFDMTPKFVVQVVTPTPTPTPRPPSNPTPVPPPGPETTNIEGLKVWEDDGDAVGVRPANITVMLYANGELASTTPKWGDRTGDAWSYSFRNLRKYDSEGKAIEYTVEELPITYYEGTIEGTVITNRLVPGEPEMMQICGEKTWKDADGESRPEAITVKLLRDGEVIETKTVTAADEWKWDFGELPLDNGYGTSYTYTVEEEPVEGYYTLIDGFNVTNVELPPPENVNLTEPELEELVDLPEYGPPVYGDLLQTGDECFELLLRSVNIIKEVKPTIMGIIYSNN